METCIRKQVTWNLYKFCIQTQYMRNQIAQGHTWIPHHDTTLSICVRHPEAASLALNTILWHEINILLYYFSSRNDTKTLYKTVWVIKKRLPGTVYV